MSSWKWMAAATLGGWLSCSSFAQSAAPSQTPAGKPAAQSDKPAEGADPSSGSGKVLFSRSTDDAPSNAAAPAKAGPGGTGTETADGLQATDDERNALTFLSYDLDVRLVPRQESLAVRARMTVRNDGARPLKRIALQLSSTLKWEQIHSKGTALSFAQHPVDSDADHTGAVNEAVITLPGELAPKEELKLDVLYSGLASLSGERLGRIGAPTLAAEKSDWDQVTSDFIGLRGFGNVVWYPVSAPPVLLGDGAKLFAEMGRLKLRNQQTRISMTVTSEFSGDGVAPNLAVLDGHVVPAVQTAAPENSFPGVVTATLPETALGFSTPSLFLLWRDKIDGNGVQVYVAADDVGSAQSIVTAVNVVTPLVQQWLGAKPKSALNVVGLPDANDSQAEDGAVFFTGFKATPDPKDLDNAMVHSLAHAYFQSPRIWLSEGVPQFLGSLWVEQVLGRETALEALASERGALALAEPGTPGENGGQNLIHAFDTVYYRTKATYVLWMLRDLAGDASLAAALQAYNPAQDTTSDYFEHLLEKSSGKDLKWFFDAWVYRDLGLPDLSIVSVFPSKSAVAGQWLIALDLANDGYADTEVPLTVTSDKTTITERLRIPGRGKISHRVVIAGVPNRIQLNDGTIPEVQDSLHIRNLTVAAQ